MSLQTNCAAPDNTTCTSQQWHQHQKFDSTFRYDSIRRVSVNTRYVSFLISIPSGYSSHSTPILNPQPPTPVLAEKLPYLIPFCVHFATPSFIYWRLHSCLLSFFLFAHSLIFFVLYSTCVACHNYLHSLHSFVRFDVMHAAYTRPTKLKISSVIRRKQKQ